MNAMTFTLAPAFQRWPEPIAIALDIFEDMKHSVFGGDDQLCTVSTGDHSLSGHLRDIGIDLVRLIPYAVFLVLVGVAIVYLPAIAQGVTNTSSVNNPSAPNSAPVQAPSQQPATSTVVPTQTVEPTQTLTPVPPTQTPTVVPTEITLNFVNTEPWDSTDFNLSPESQSCVGMSRDYFLTMVIPALHLDKTQTWAYTGGGPSGNEDSRWNIFPWPTPPSRQGVGYSTCKNEVFIILFNRRAYNIFKSLPVASGEDYNTFLPGRVWPLTVP